MSEIVNIPDENFRNYILKKLNKPSDYNITKEDCENIETINCDDKNIKTLDSIEHFTNLIFFNCSYNKLINLDLSNNIKLKRLYCYNNKLTSLDLSKNISLTSFWCSNNQLISLDLSKNISLSVFYCHNNKFTNIILNKKINRTRYFKSIITNFNNLTIEI